MDIKELPETLHILNKIYKIKAKKIRPFEILIHGILSTRTRDETTFPAQRRLLNAANTPEKLLLLDRKTIEGLIYPVGFYKIKAKLLLRACGALIKKFGGTVPRGRKELLEIPGVGPKVASLVQVWGFGMPVIPVDTHVNRISQRLGLVPKGNAPEKTQLVLERVLNSDQRMVANMVLVNFGRDICRPVYPQCYRCPIYGYCVFEEKEYFYKKGTTGVKSYKLLKP
jgi:endonuclease-3